MKSGKTLIDQIYVQGTDGSRNLFFRPKGLVVFTSYFGWFLQDKDEYIIQWRGTPDWDSDFHKQGFDTLEDALKIWNDLKLYPTFAEIESTI
jgi:hypothetical protein